MSFHIHPRQLSLPPPRQGPAQLWCRGTATRIRRGLETGVRLYVRRGSPEWTQGPTSTGSVVVVMRVDWKGAVGSNRAIEMEIRVNFRVCVGFCVFDFINGQERWR